MPFLRLSCLFVAFIAVLGLGTGCERKAAPKKGGAGGIFTVDVMVVKPGPLRETISATGSLVARESVQLQPERDGVVREIFFEEGKPAKKGDVLLAIDDSELQAQLQRAQSQLELSKTIETRQRDLLKSRGISEAEYDTSQANLKIAEAEVALIKAQLAKTKLHAPFDGVCGLRRVSVGAYLTTSSVVTSFQDISSLKIDFSVPERYLPHIRVGQKLRFRITGREEEFEAEIAALEPSIEVATRSLLVRAVVPNPGQRLLPGSFAEVEVVLDEIQDAILIPPIALVPGLKQQTVFVHKDGVVEARKVETGLRLADAVQVIAGLQLGEELVTSGVLQLRPGAKVAVNRVDQPSAAVSTAKGVENIAREGAGE